MQHRNIEIVSIEDRGPDYRCQREGVLRELLRNKSSSGRFIPGIIFRSIFFRAKKILAEFFSGKKIPEFLMNIIPSQEYGFLRIARNVYSGVKFREEKFL